MLHLNRSRLEQLKRQDYVGCILFVGGLTTFLMGISWGGQVYPWKSAPVIVTIVVGFLALAAFAVYGAFRKYIYHETWADLAIKKSISVMISSFPHICKYIQLNIALSIF
jgi:hypothetical protein